MSNLKVPNISIQCKMVPGYPPTVNNIDCASFCKDIVREMTPK